MSAPTRPPGPTTPTDTYSVALSFEDGVTRFVTCRSDQTVADASYRSRINIPLDCRDGACGTCKALCESGSYDGGTYIDDALSADEASAGYVLPCSMRPRSDLVLQIAGTSESAKTQASDYSGTLTQLQRLSSTTVKIGIDIPNRGELTFLPGQYVNIAVPGTDQSRSYSFANAPHEERLTFLVKLTPGGAMSDYLANRAAVGDAITFTGPNGSFFLRDADRPVLLLAGGTGLAPVLSMLRAMAAQQSRRRTHLIYGVSTDVDLVAIDEIAAVGAELPDFSWDHCVSDPHSTAINRGPERAYVTSLIDGEHLHGGDVAIYLCGPPPMVEAVRTHLNGAGVEPTGFYYEKFGLANTTEATAATAGSATRRATGAEASEESVLTAPDARGVVGQTVLPRRTIAPLAAYPPTSEADDTARRISGQVVLPALPQHDDEPVISTDGYEIGEEHPDMRTSDALFEARAALELGALELTVGRLDSAQLAGYRLLAESTLPYVDGDRFVDPAQYTETNAAFHDYLFTMTGNEHLLHAYQALDVKGRMSATLRRATWCHPRCATDHVEIVDAIEAGDRAGARALISAHAQRSMQTMRRAMADAAAAPGPAFTSPGRFSGKVVIVTGAAQGIGEHTARRVHAEGGTVVLADRSALVKELADELSATAGPQALAVTVDLEHAEGADDLIRQTLATFRTVDVLINNVGGAINFKPFTEFSAEQIRAEIDRSLMTTLYSCRSVLPTMVERGHGVIVNVSSVATRGIHRIPYSAAKGGVNALTASLAMEYADTGIRVVAAAPGGTAAPPRRISRGTPTPATDTEQAWFDAHVEQTLDSSLFKRYATLDEQAAVICFLASDEASFITGTVLPVAGGDLG
ncbi:oxidoreductase [Mycolicibacterium duvalii]|uniref:Oxidoreductase n=1 Tax=Mycolicibacterium duvalii TaxID=39688 RepID=A0A7I7K4Q4_9MYCO|nr:benzoate 1,2-dioxygenase electron transfer component BenC [Mycolicibacterium duvalii]MCV7368960.1 1,6-dihydroxycyclohexa-2,4-diene-1-carboxylate dehydrogenase [Mycolicibacterium duvalii]PEG44443.1 oxidoreductase [Mycolicibacterium duvalii]BBX19140.1 oxidoreductase [Mycolicibacterium duvalii]